MNPLSAAQTTVIRSALPFLPLGTFLYPVHVGVKVIGSLCGASPSVTQHTRQMQAESSHTDEDSNLLEVSGLHSAWELALRATPPTSSVLLESCHLLWLLSEASRSTSGFLHHLGGNGA